MKRLIIILFTVFLFTLPVSAEEITVTNESIVNSFEAENYIPPGVKDTLENGNIPLNSPETAKSVLGFVKEAIKDIFKEYSADVGILFGVIIFVSVFYKFIDNKCFKTIISYIIALIILVQVFNIIKNILTSTLGALNALSDILNAVLPAFSAILLMGGSTFTSVTESASFAAVLSLLTYAINTLVLPCVSLLMLLLMFERLSPQLSELNLLKFFKKNILTVMSFITMIMLTVISYQHIVSAGKDSVSGRTVKFAASNFIPIVGSAVGESFKTLSSGLKYLKNTVGGAVMLSLVITVLPAILQIFLAKIYFNFLGFTAGITGCKSEQGVFESSVSILDILNAIIICISVLSLLLVITFMLSAFAVSV